ncbi:MAG TPA: class I tRNA ligase family protein [Solirubrobacteraceae bacterium]|jgi:leucyl-tRNA synthetase|nr:class I tRNA ligase family protein [Solirubrobacteraceae bacterium]
MSDAAHTPANTRYEPDAIEARRQASWRERDAFRTPPLTDARTHIYIKPSAPFTSGNVHIGHVRSYSIGDAYARFRRARGDAVLFAFGFDAFGLPAELGAIAGGESPSDWVHRCAEHMTGQLQRLGFSFDWERSFLSSDAVMYRWSQWLFLTLLEAGLIYHGTGNVDWCDTCQTTLASIQVEAGGTCWRCHGPVRLIQLPQWYLKVSAYLQENDRRLAERAGSGMWDDVALSSQEIVLGRVDGVELDLTQPSGPGPSPDGAQLTVFTPHADALADARFVLMSARHPDADAWASDGNVGEQLEQLRSGGWERSSREAETIPVIDTGRVVLTADGAELPVLVSPLVDSRFGPTVALGVPSRDRTDEVIARRLGLDAAGDGEAAPATAHDGSDRVASTNGASAPGSAAAAHGRPAVRYKAFDWVISRQRSWGTPIPIVYCEKCGTVPVPREQLPVVLPLDLRPTGTGNPLAELDEFVSTTCPTCGGPARRETDTLDCHFDALWLWIPACVPGESREDSLEEILALADLRHWLPSERLVAGSDSGNFVFDQRTVAKALRDIGPLAFLEDGEPFAGCLFHEMVTADGRKMSKHLGNVVDPDDLVARYGADTVRLAVLYAASPQKSLNWSDSAVLRCSRFLAQVWEYSHGAIRRRASGEEQGAAPATLASGADGAAADAPVRDTSEHLRLKLTQWCEAGVRRITKDMENLEMHSAVRNVMRLFDRIKDFEKRVVSRDGELSQANLDALVEALGVLAQTLGPFAPHMAEELWIALGHDAHGAQTPWPSVSFEIAA